MRAHAAALFALLLVSRQAAAAAPRSIADCEAIEAADAYNRCLAAFGPTRSGGGRRGPWTATERARPHLRAQPPGVAIEQARGGRLRLTLTPRGR